MQCKFVYAGMVIVALVAIGLFWAQKRTLADQGDPRVQSKGPVPVRTFVRGLHDE
jgi:hypothetical protein